ncbi:uncharacterized protein LOC135937447 [Cloeon dipterum]|uniref:uncharacterized protein LOC135937447 n=1 Tax=Cloeon dipterum TaxID=197152 RepID=UPI00322022C0
MHKLFPQDSVEAKGLDIFDEVAAKSEDALQMKTAFCNLPDYDPFDPSILPHIKTWPRINCGGKQLPLTFLDENELLQINTTAVSLIGGLSCYIQEIIQLKNDESKVKLGPAKKITKPERLPYEFNFLNCELEPSRAQIYATGYAKVKEVPKIKPKRGKAASNDSNVNVLIFVLDSTSRLNFIRQLPKSSKFINERAKGIVLEGLTKVGDNTYPNMLALLSGYSDGAEGADESQGPFRQDATGRFPITWKYFSEHGYVTMFAEDQPDVDTFSFKERGFHVPPTDYVMRPFWQAMEQFTVGRQDLKSDRRCYGHIPKHVFLFNYTRDFAVKMQKEGRAFFSLTFSTPLSHNRINSVQVADDDLLKLLQDLEMHNIFNNTVVLIMGDHGNRIGDARRTAIGRVEDRMPNLAIMIPPSLEHFRQALEANAKVLTSWHDVRETLLDVAMNNLETESKVLRHGFRGLSLFRPIPSNRTCLEIGIPIVYCVCWIEKELNVDETDTRIGANIFLTLLNNILQKRDKEKLCTRLKLKNIEGAQKLLPTQAVGQFDNSSKILRIMITVKPSDALLEGTLEINGNKARLLGDVNRLNEYGKQSRCINDASLKLFCFCQMY